MDGIKEKLEQGLQKYIHNITNKNSEEAKKQYCISTLFEKIFDVASEDLDFEVPTKTVSQLRGRADTLFQNIIFEWKQDAKNSKAIDDGEIELKKYFQHFLEKEPLKKYVGIITDGIIFKPYLPIIKKDEVTDLSVTNELDISKALPEEILYWFDNYLHNVEKIKPTSKSIKMQFGLSSPYFIDVRNELDNLFEKVRDYKDVKLKFDNWSDYLEIVYGEKQKGKELFFRHTYLSTLVKLLVHLKLSYRESMRMDEILPILLGNRFTQAGIMNFSEEDFFTWPLNISIRKQSSQIFSKLLVELERYDIDAIDEDVLKELYQELVSPEVRKQLGEFYTPDWLAEKMVIETLEDNPLKSVLDPACGSGTFLFKTIQFKIKKLTKKGMKKTDILKHITENVFGFDVHPLAAIISKTNYLLSLRDLLADRREEITIPVFLSDSLKIPEMRNDVSSGLKVLEFEAVDKKFFFPEDIAGDMLKMDDVLNNLKTHGSTLYQNLEQARSRNYTISEDEINSNLLSSYEVSIKDIQDSNVKRVLLDNAKILFELIRNNLDSIWPYILRNMYRPISLSYKKVDLIIGNPPWISLKDMKNHTYQNFLKIENKNFGLSNSKKPHLTTQMELATLFFCKSVKSYLNKKGMIAFVMPYSILVGEQHKKFLEFSNPEIKIHKIYDLENVKPLFRNLSCVIIGETIGKTKYPIPRIMVKGKLEKGNLQLNDVEQHLSSEKINFNPFKNDNVKRSVYNEKFYEGANIYPRNFFSVIPELTLGGMNIQKPKVTSNPSNDTKPPWSDVKISQEIEKEFLFASLFGGDVLPFGNSNYRLIALPVAIKNGKPKVYSSYTNIQRAGYLGAARFFEQVEQYWIKYATPNQKKFSIYDYINMRQKIETQNTSQKYKVLYPYSGTYLVSCVIDTSKKIIVRFDDTELEVNDFFVDNKTLGFDTNDISEAHYLCAFFNSKILDVLIKPTQTRGLFGPRDIGRRPLQFPIPEYDSSNKFHEKLANISQNCHEKVKKIIPTLSYKSTGKIRQVIKASLQSEISQIGDITKTLLKV